VFCVWVVFGFGGVLYIIYSVSPGCCSCAKTVVFVCDSLVVCVYGNEFALER
jgi:hypothetical protein